MLLYNQFKGNNKIKKNKSEGGKIMVQVASLLRRGQYKRAEREAFRRGINYFDFTELVKRFYKGTINDIEP
jgi:hypothetical protein